MTLAWPVRSVLSGAAGTLTMTAAYGCARRFRGDASGPLDYDDSPVPGQIVATLMRRGPVGARRERHLGLLLRWSYGSALGVVHGHLRRAVGEPRATAAFGGTVIASTMTLFPLLGGTPPPWRWPSGMLATSLGTHAAYVAAVGAAATLRRPGRARA